MLSEERSHIVPELLVSDQIVSIFVDLVEGADHIADIDSSGDKSLGDLFASEGTWLGLLGMEDVPERLIAVVVDLNRLRRIVRRVPFIGVAFSHSWLVWAAGSHFLFLFQKYLQI